MEFEPIQQRGSILPSLISLASLTGCKPEGDLVFNPACTGIGVASQLFAMQSFTSGCY